MSRRRRSTGSAAKPKPAPVFRGDLSALADDDIESIFRFSSEERPLAKAKIGPAGPPTPTPASRSHGGDDAGPSAGGGSDLAAEAVPLPGPGNNHGTGCEPVSSALAPPRMVCRRALRGTLQPLFEEPSTWRQQLLPRLQRPKQALSFSSRRRPLACSTTSASRCRPRACLPRPRDGDYKTDRSLPTSGPTTAGDGSSCELCQTSYPLPALPCISLQPLARYILCCALSGPWPWPGSVPRSRHLSLACAPAVSLLAVFVTARLPLPLASTSRLVWGSINLLWRPLWSSSCCHPWRLVNLTLLPKQIWLTRLPSLNDNTSNGRQSNCNQAPPLSSPSPPPPSASCRRHLRLLPR